MWKLHKCPSAVGWMNKLVWRSSGILLSHEKGMPCASDVHHGESFGDMMLSDRRTTCGLLSFYEISKVGKSRGTEERLDLPGRRRQGA